MCSSLSCRSLARRFSRLFLALVAIAVVQHRLPAQELASTPASSGNDVYLLAPFDKVKVSIYGEPDLDSEQRISDRGLVSFPLLGSVEVGAKTLAEAQQQIEHAFVEQRYLKKPVVTISIEEFAAKSVTVLGQVEKPGSVVIPDGQNGIPIQQAIADAGGFTGTAKSGEVRITRTAPDGQKTYLSIDVNRILESGDTTGGTGLFVQAGDVVFVPRRLF